MVMLYLLCLAPLLANGQTAPVAPRSWSSHVETTIVLSNGQKQHSSATSYSDVRKHTSTHYIDL